MQGRIWGQRGFNVQRNRFKHHYPRPHEAIHRIVIDVMSCIPPFLGRHILEGWLKKAPVATLTPHRIFPLHVQCGITTSRRSLPQTRLLLRYSTVKHYELARSPSLLAEGPLTRSSNSDLGTTNQNMLIDLVRCQFPTSKHRPDSQIGRWLVTV